jgi:hypothetical protein
VPLIGRLPLQKLRPSHVIALEQRLRASGNRKTGAGPGPAAVQKVHSVLHRAMAHAVRRCGWRLSAGCGSASSSPSGGVTSTLERGCLVVRRALDLPAADGSPRFKETKTHRAERPVSLPTQLVEDLREHRRQQVERRLAAATRVDLDLVFTSDGGLPLVPVTLRKYLYRVLEQAGLPRVRLHGLRQQHGDADARQR